MAVLVLAVAVAALRQSALPRWFGALSVPLGLALAIPGIGAIAMIVFVFWVGIAGVAMLTHRAPRDAAPAARSMSAAGRTA